MKFKVSLSSIRDIRDFVTLTKSIEEDVSIYEGIYKIDGKSIMGIFSLSLSEPVVVEIEGDNNNETLRKFSRFLINYN